MKRTKIKCYYCDNKATWWYAPCDYENGEKTWWQRKSLFKKDHYCDIHVPRGCSCNNVYEDELDEDDSKENLTLIGKSSSGQNIYATLDHRNREYPCCEFWYDKNGWEV